ncbi:MULTISPECIES: hypothetical protein [unclassified Paenibacillus]|uniref:hypothetical protein n=1 Tax=unclassified Paenibacillus TaxID=185978 RepID=UPI00095458A2|nr:MULTISPECIES: hypothetical protein [unclassified Paenibacillus]ASS66367.1 DUF2612 domain-containing protein [Paenibacillus sp. RUD330]SIQ06549.1 hypothetical protein SAMN05880555_0512 [Paenibacillus sp. RU4X]SIQ26661.1 hypothetical protein SAMN05880570_0511 [Paenibacillus sp. RU4T]
MISVKDLLRRLPDYFDKRAESTLGRLLGIVSAQLAELEATQNQIREWRDIETARGPTLDRIGVNVGQPRGVATDEVYRILIKSKIARNRSTGDINTIIRVLSVALSCPPSDIQIEEMWASAAPEPATISLIKLPMKQLNAAGMDLMQFARIVQRAVAAGVRVGAIELSGTFSFAGDDVTSSPQGFADLSGAAGGTLGAVYAPSNSTDLPI